MKDKDGGMKFIWAVIGSIVVVIVLAIVYAKTHKLDKQATSLPDALTTQEERQKAESTVQTSEPPKSSEIDKQTPNED